MQFVDAIGTTKMEVCKYDPMFPLNESAALLFLSCAATFKRLKAPEGHGNKFSGRSASQHDEKKTKILGTRSLAPHLEKI